MATFLDRRTLRLPEFSGDRLTVRMDHIHRQKLRQIAAEEGVSESELVRQAIALLVEVFGSDASDSAT